MMFRNEIMYKKSIFNVKTEERNKDIMSFKFPELSLDNILKVSENYFKPNFNFKTHTSNAKARQENFANNLSMKTHQLTVKSVSLQISDPSKIVKRKTLFPTKTPNNTKVQFKNCKTFSKYIQPLKLGNFNNWLKHSTNRTPIDIEDLIKNAEQPKIEKLIPIMYQLGTDIVPSYLLRKTRKFQQTAATIKIRK